MNPVERALSRWGAYAATYPRRVLLSAALLSLVLAPFAVRALTHLDANLFNQASNSLRRFRILREVNETFGGDILAAAISIPTEHTPEQVQALKDMGNRLSAEMERIGTRPEEFAALPATLQQELPSGKPWLRHVECRTGQGLEQALKRIVEQRPFVLLTPGDVALLKKKFEPEALAASLELVAQTLADLPSNSAEKERLREDPLNILESGRKAFQDRIAQRKQALATDPEGYFVSPDGTMLVVLARTALPATRLDFDRALLAALEKAKVAVGGSLLAIGNSAESRIQQPAANSQQPPSITIGFTGLPIISAQNEQSVRFDLIVNTATSFLAVLALFVIVYRSVTLTWDVIWTTALIILWTVAVGGIAHGSLSLLGGAFTAVPLGLGTDYTILLYNTFYALRHNEKLSAPEAMQRTLVRCGPSVLTAAAITAIAFLGIGFTRLTGLAEFGFLGGVSALIGAVIILLVLPAALCLSSRVNRLSAAKPLTFGVPAWGRMLERKSIRAAALAVGLLVAGLGVALIACGPDPGPETVAGVRFDPELGNLRSLNIPAIPLRQELTKKFGLGLADLRVVIDAPDEDRAFAGAEAAAQRLTPFIEHGDLKHDGSIFDFIPSAAQQRENIAALKSFDAEAAVGAFQTASVKRFGEKGLVFFKPFLKHLSDFGKLTRESTVLTLASLMDSPLATFLSPYVKIDKSDSPAGGHVRLALAWFPAKLDLPEALYDEVAAKLETNPPPGTTLEVTAARMVGFELKRSVLADCGWITATTGICVAISLAVALRSLSQSLLATVPLLFAYIFMLAGVPLAQALHRDFSLNFVNLMMFPLLLGSAIDYGLYLVFDAYSPRRPSVSALLSGTGCSVLYCMGTTLIAFGSFVTSSHTGLISMGIASLFGYTGALFGALVVLPALLGSLRRKA